VNDLTVAWLAGWLEGEGHFYVRSVRDTQWEWGITAASTDQDVILTVAALLKVKLRSGPSVEPPRSPYWVFALNRRQDVLDVCELIYPYMGSRRKGTIREMQEISDEHPPLRTLRSKGVSV
jgi:hypothetical protein